MVRALRTAEAKVSHCPDTAVLACFIIVVAPVVAATRGEFGIALATSADRSALGADSMKADIPSSAPAMLSIAPASTVNSPLTRSPKRRAYGVTHARLYDAAGRPAERHLQAASGGR